MKKVLSGLASAGVPATPAGGNLTVFDAHELPQDVRLDGWMEHLGQHLAAFDFNVSSREPFEARLESLSLGPISVHRGDCSSAHWERLRRHLADGRADYALCLSVDSRYRFVQGDVDTVMEPGSGLLIDNGVPMELFVDAVGANYDLVIPRALLRDTQRVRALSAPPILSINATALRLLSAYVESVFASKHELSDPVTAAKIGEHLLDLVVLGLQPTPDAAQSAKTRGLRAARLRAALGVVEKQFGDPAISAKSVAATINISESYLHKLLEEQGLVFNRMILDLRLNRAFLMLRDRRLDYLQIAQIAYECGFNDLSYFHRCFRAAYGDTPGSVRGARSA